MVAFYAKSGGISMNRHIKPLTAQAVSLKEYVLPFIVGIVMINFHF
jgi:hypothetical protein